MRNKATGKVHQSYKEFSYSQVHYQCAILVWFSTPGITLQPDNIIDDSIQTVTKFQTKFYWNDELNGIFHKSKEAIVAAITKEIKCFDLGETTCLQPDLSTTGIGYFLLQNYCFCNSDVPGCCQTGWRIVLAGSHFVTSSELRYAAVKGESLAIVWALEQSQYFIQGCDRLLALTDHKPLVKLFGDRTLGEIENPHLFWLKQRSLCEDSRFNINLENYSKCNVPPYNENPL